MRECLPARHEIAPASSARVFAPSTSDCAARRPAPQLTHWLTKSGAAGPGRLADDSLHGIADQVFGDRHLAHDFMKLKHVLAVE